MGVFFLPIDALIKIKMMSLACLIESSSVCAMLLKNDIQKVFRGSGLFYGKFQ